MRHVSIATMITFLFLWTSCSEKSEIPQVPVESGTLVLDVKHRVGADPVVLEGNVTTAQQHVLQLEEIAYYISNIRLQTANGYYTIPNSYHLVRQSNRFGSVNRMRITLPNIPVGEYTGIEFLIGVDSLRNFRIDQVGDLDPNSGMAWDWNTGYKFFVLEGKVMVTDILLPLVYHVGEVANLRSRQQQTGAMKVVNGATLSRSLVLDLNKVFQSTHTIDPKASREVMDGRDASKIADNVRDAFSIATP